MRERRAVREILIPKLLTISRYHNASGIYRISSGSLWEYANEIQAEIHYNVISIRPVIKMTNYL